MDPPSAPRATSPPQAVGFPDPNRARPSPRKPLPPPPAPSLAPAPKRLPLSRRPQPPFALPPDDPNLARCVRCVARHVAAAATAGMDLESETLARQAGAPAFDFMRGGAGGAFYEWCAWATFRGMDPGRPPGTEGFEPATMEAAARRIAEAATEAEKTRAAEAQRLGAWRAARDANGRTYFWNRTTGKTRWDHPCSSSTFRG